MGRYRAAGQNSSSERFKPDKSQVLPNCRSQAEAVFLVWE
jgi:hypothetical protein